MKKVTMQVIADELHVSKALVSKALANHTGVSDETKERVRLTAIRLGYQTNSSKFKLANSRTGNVAVLIPQPDLKDLGYWGEVIRGIEQELSCQSVSLILAGIDTSQQVSRGMPGCISDRKVDGAIFLGQVPTGYILEVTSSGIPAVLIDTNAYTLKLDHVLADNYGGAYEAVLSLLERGHRHLGFVGNTRYSWSFAERYRGFSSALTDFRLQYPSETIKETLLTEPGRGGDDENNYHRQQVEKLLGGDGPVPTALFCANDPISFNVLKLLREHGLHCPEDVSLLSFDNTDSCNWSHPHLSSVDPRKKEMGMRGAQLLLRRIEFPETPPERVMITTTLVERQSVASKQNR